MYTLSMQQKVTVISALLEGNSIRSIERMTGTIVTGTIVRKRRLSAGGRGPSSCRLRFRLLHTVQNFGLAQGVV